MAARMGLSSSLCLKATTYHLEVHPPTPNYVTEAKTIHKRVEMKRTAFGVLDFLTIKFWTHSGCFAGKV